MSLYLYSELVKLDCHAGGSGEAGGGVAVEFGYATLVLNFVWKNDAEHCKRNTHNIVCKDNNDEMSRYFNFLSSLTGNTTASGAPLASPLRTPLSNITARTSGSNVSSLTNSKNVERTAALLTLAKVANASTVSTMNPTEEEEECDTRCCCTMNALEHQTVKTKAA